MNSLNDRMKKVEERVKDFSERVNQLRDFAIQADKKADKLTLMIESIKNAVTGKKKRVDCEKCGYFWKTESRMDFISCPRCMAKIKNNSKKLSKYVKVNGDLYVRGHTPGDMLKEDRESNKKVDKIIKKITEENKKYPSNLIEKLKH